MIDIDKELNSEEYKDELYRLVKMRKSILYCLLFCYMNASRDGISNKKNFFLRMIDDITQSITSIEVLVKEGIINTCKRELRYLLEVAIKCCLIVNKNSKKDFDINNSSKVYHHSN